MDLIELAKTELEEGRPQFADLRLSQLLKDQPDHVEALRLKARILLQRRAFPLAADLLNRVARLDPSPSGWLDAATAFRQAGNLAEAESALREYLGLVPEDWEALVGLGQVLHRRGRIGGAYRVLERAARLKSHPALSFLLGKVSVDLGLRQEGLLLLKEGFPHDPLGMWPDLVNNTHREGDLAPEAYLQEIASFLPAPYRAWIDPRQVFPRGTDPQKRLRVGYVGGDFRRHVVAGYLLGFLGAHDPAQVEVFLFAEVPVPDATTARFRALPGVHWVPTAGIPDGALAAKARALDMDILVDLSGFTAHHRLGLFALRGAPIQVAHTAGYGPTRAMPNLDVKLSSAMADPPGSGDAWHTETVIRIEGARHGFTWPEGSPPVSPLPSAQGNPFTFGCLGNPNKVTPASLDAFAEVLRRVPESRFLCLWTHEDDLEGVAFRKAQFEARGIDPARIEMVFRADREVFLAYHHRVDLALDPFPVYGSTTILDAFWMGIPVLHLDLPGAVRHGGRALYHVLGLGDWVTDSPEAYVAAACEWAARPGDLAALRTTLRDRMAASPFADPPTVAGTLERTYRALWTDWCEGRFPYRKG